MKSKHQVAEHLAHCAAEYFNRESNRTSLLTVTRAEMNEAMTVCTISVIVFPETHENDALIFAKRSITDLRAYLQRTAKMNRVPHIEIELDAGEKHRAHVDALLKTLPQK